MSDSSARTFHSDFRQFFVRGLVVLLPSVLTLWIAIKAYQFVDRSIAEPINRSVRVAMVHTSRVWTPLQEKFDPTPESIGAERRLLQENGKPIPNDEVLRAQMRSQNISKWWSDRWYLDLIGLVVAIIAVYIAGRLLGGFFGRRLYRRIEQVITTLPIFKQVYPHVKQIVDFLFSDERPIKFNRVVVVEYPRKGIWSVGFLTGNTMQSIADKSGDAVTIFIPSSPTPFTGYTLTVPRSEVLELPISVEEAIRFAVSGGVLIPDHQIIQEAVQAQLERAGEDAKPIQLSNPEAPSTDERDGADPAADQPRRNVG